jgi:hypothetical protein
MFVERKDVVEPGSKRACVWSIVPLRCVGLDRRTWVIILRWGLFWMHLIVSLRWAGVGVASAVGGPEIGPCGGSWSILPDPVLWIGLPCDMLAGPVWLVILMVQYDGGSICHRR